jgi:hypothetical protein
MNGRTIFYDLKGKPLAVTENLLPIPFYQGMKITLDGNEMPFEVVELEYHQKQADEKSELCIILKESPKWKKNKFLSV